VAAQAAVAAVGLEQILDQSVRNACDLFAEGIVRGAFFLIFDLFELHVDWRACRMPGLSKRPRFLSHRINSLDEQPSCPWNRG
jgi:hypothetical protein